MPLKGFLFSKKSDGKRRLTMDFSTPIEDMYVEDLIVKVRGWGTVVLLGCRGVDGSGGFGLKAGGK